MQVLSRAECKPRRRLTTREGRLEGWRRETRLWPPFFVYEYRCCQSGFKCTAVLIELTPFRGKLPISSDCVFDASLVPETCLNRFADLKGLTPKNMRDFQRQFASEEVCQDHLAGCRWPDGFTCPRCGHTRAYRLVKHRRLQCAGCRFQVSLTSGTILHNTKTPLILWFWAAYLTVTDKRGISALLLQRQLGLRRYKLRGCCCTSYGARW